MSMNDQVGSPATAVAMEGPEHRIRRAEAVLRRWKHRIDTGDTDGMTYDELRAVLGDAWDMANEVVKANELLEQQARRIDRPSLAELAGRSAAPLNEQDVRHIVATEMARVMLSQVLLGENSQLVASSRQYKERASKLDAECAELNKKLSEANEQALKWKDDAQRWAMDFLTLARMLGVPDDVRDRSIVARATELVAQKQGDSIGQATSAILAGLDELAAEFGNQPVSAANLLALLRKNLGGA